jgi:hypothetical protein
MLHGETVKKGTQKKKKKKKKIEKKKKKEAICANWDMLKLDDDLPIKGHHNLLKVLGFFFLKKKARWCGKEKQRRGWNDWMWVQYDCL